MCAKYANGGVLSVTPCCNFSIISEHRIIVNADVVGAYLNALIEKDVYIKFDVYESELFCKMYPEYLQFMNVNNI